MKTALMITITILAAASIAAAFSVKCASCNGTGWRGQFRCAVCGGDGDVGR